MGPLMATLQSTKPSCILSLPFGKEDGKGELYELYNTALYPAIQAAGFTAIRLDQMESSEFSVSSPQTAIQAADVFIAVFTKSASRVVYEFGFALGLKKKTILIVEQETSVPFDIALTHVLKFIKGDRYSLVELRDNLKRALIDFSEQLDLEQISFPNKIEEARHEQSVVDSNIQRAMIEADEAFDRGRFTEALRTLTRAMANLEPSGDAQSMIILLNRIAILHQQRGDFKSALYYLTRASSLVPKVSSKEKGATYVNLASALQALGEVDRASELYHDAVAVAEQTGDRRIHAVALSNLGDLLHRKGDLEKATRAYEQSLEDFQALNDERSAALVHASLAAVWQARGDFDRSEVLLQFAATSMERLGDRAGLASVWHNRASILMERGDYEAAADLLQRSLDEKQKAGDLAGSAVTLYNLAMVNGLQGRLASCVNILQEALAIQERVGDREGQMRSLVMIGEASNIAGDAAAALAFLRQALQIANEIGSPRQDHIRQRLFLLSGEGK